MRWRPPVTSQTVRGAAPMLRAAPQDYPAAVTTRSAASVDPHSTAQATSRTMGPAQPRCFVPHDPAMRPLTVLPSPLLRPTTPLPRTAGTTYPAPSTHQMGWPIRTVRRPAHPGADAAGQCCDDTVWASSGRAACARVLLCALGLFSDLSPVMQICRVRSVRYHRERRPVTSQMSVAPVMIGGMTGRAAARCDRI
jgi:hypothetical protein